MSSCVEIGVTFYEKSEGFGNVILAACTHPAVRSKIQFSEPIKLADIRASRKLLQLGSAELALHTNGEEVFGLIEFDQKKCGEENAFEIRFLGHHHLKFLFQGQVLLAMKNGQPYLPRPTYDEEKLRDDIRRVFRRIPSVQVERLLDLIRQAEQERHGTTLVISEQAKREAERLIHEGTRIRPKRLSPVLLEALTPIDGAVLLSPAGTCHAVGVILDGMACAKGSSSRGARYNSAIRYVETVEHACLAVIVSEDGGVDFYPHLPPRIPRADVEEAIRGLDEFLRTGEVHYGRLILLLDRLDQHRFYLLAEDCERINDLVAKIEDKFEDSNNGERNAFCQPFIPDDDMDSDFFYESECEPR